MPTIGGGVGVPAGGSTGQALAKIDGVDYHTSWQTITGGGGGAGAYWDTPEAHGAAGDGLTDDVTAVNTAITAVNANPQGGLVILNPSKTYAVSSPVLMRDGVRLVGGQDGKISGARPSGRIVPLATFPTDRYVIEQQNPATHLTDAQIIGVSIAATPPTSSASRRWGGIKLDWGNMCRIAGCSIGGVSLPAINLVNGVGCQVENNGVQYFPLYRTLTANEGAVIIGGTDHHVVYNQCNGGDNTAVQTSQFYRAGLLVVGLACWFESNNGEYSDVGIMVVGDGNTFLGDRGDFNAGPGFYFQGAVGNGCTQLKVISDSVGGSGLYDGIVFDASSYANTIEGVVVGSTPGVVYRNIVNDLANTGTNPLGYPYNPNVVLDIKGNWSQVANDIYQTVIPYQSTHRPGSSSPYFRPPARHCAGLPWTDTLNGGKHYSDGIVWRDDGGDIASNKVTAKQHTYIGSVAGDTTITGWTTVNSTFLVVDGHTAFGRPDANQVKVTSTGVTAGAAGAVTTLLACRPGEWYTPITKSRALGTAANCVVGLQWFNPSGGLVGASTTTSTALGAAGASGTECVGVAAIVPVGVTQMALTVTFSRGGPLVLNELFEHVENCIVPGNWAIHPVEV